MSRTKHAFAILAALIFAAAVIAGCSQPSKQEAAKTGDDLIYRPLCERMSAELIKQSNNKMADSEMKQQLDACMNKAADRNKGGNVTADQKKAYVKHIIDACKVKEDTGAPWLDCYKNEEPSALGVEKH